MFLNKFLHNLQNNIMLTIFFRGLIIFAVLLVIIRLMGKRQIGEMEPFELVITLVISEIACIPMGDSSIPLIYGIVCILTLYVVHQFIVLLMKNSKLQSLISGKPLLVINKNGIDKELLKKLNMQTCDLLQAIRSAGFFSIDEIKYALMETNGQLSVIPKKNLEEKQQRLPIPVILDGRWSEDDLKQHNISKDKAETLIKRHKLKLKNIMLFTVDETNHVVIQPANRPIFCFDLMQKEEQLI